MDLSPLPFYSAVELGWVGPELSRAPSLTRASSGMCPDPRWECSRDLSGVKQRRKGTDTTRPVKKAKRAGAEPVSLSHPMYWSPGAGLG